MTTSEIGSFKSKISSSSSSRAKATASAVSINSRKSNINVNSSANSSVDNESGSEDDCNVEEGVEYDTKKPLYVIYKVYTMTMDNVPPSSLLTRVKMELDGYRDCVQKGPNPETILPTTLSKGAEFYRWETWRDCTCILNRKTWTPNKFKEAAIKKYISIAQKYLVRLEVDGCCPEKKLTV